jgi:hypothetical protein
MAILTAKLHVGGKEACLIEESGALKERPETMVRRRDLLGVALAGAGATVASSVALEPAAAKSVALNDKRRARYQADSAEVRNFYRVNNYPVR